MGFWIFMLSMTLIIPAVLIIFGTRFAKKPPKSINMYYGFRTSRSMKNKDTWDFAHRHFGRTARLTGWILLPLSVAVMLLALGKDTSTVSVFGLALCCVQLVPLIGLIFPTERALEREFDEYGNRRKQGRR